MNSQGKKYLVSSVVLWLVAVLAFVCPAVANEEFLQLAPTDGKVMSPLSEPDGAAPVVSVGSSYLSDKQFGTGYGGKVIKSIRPGETIYGVYNCTLSGAGATLDRLYRIAKYPGLQETFSTYYNTGSLLFSWGFEIPDNRAANGDTPAFYYRLTASGGNAVAKNLNFTVIRKGITNSTRAYQDPMPAATKTKILANIATVKNRLTASALKYNTIYYASSATAGAFLASLKAHRPNATLIHAHGNSTEGGRIFLVDDSYVNATKVLAAFTGSNAKYKPPAGLFYAAVCKGAVSSTLGQSFVTAGYKAFIGYKATVYTQRNADFYKYFFAKATQPNVSVSAALQATRAWALAKTPAWTDVGTATIIGDGTIVYLGGKSTTTSAEEGTEGEDMKIPVTDWTDISHGEIGYRETLAVEAADQLPEVQDLKAEYGPNLATGIEDLATVYRVSYKDKAKGKFLYGVDVDKATGQVMESGELD